MTEPRQVMEAVFREEHGLVLASLIRYTGDIQLAEDALQDACIAALGAWRNGIPNNPAAWLTTAARRKAIDRVRRAKNLELKYQALGHIDENTEPEPMYAVEDDRLRLIFTCCHPAVAPEARVALTLRTVGGLKTPEIARAFLVSESTMAQRLVRAKNKIRQAGIPYRVPDENELPDRLPGVLSVIYLIFNEGYAASSGEEHLRSALTAEAIRLGCILDDLVPDEPEIIGLRALMELHDARSATRVDADGTPVLLPDQDRSMWDTSRIDAAVELLDRAVTLGEPGPYQIQAAIASLHAKAPTADDTDWPQIAELYASLRRYVPTPVVELNHAVAISMAGYPDTALGMIDRIEGLESYPYFHTARASFLSDANRHAEARASYETALSLTESETERRFLTERIRQLEPT